MRNDEIIREEFEVEGESSLSYDKLVERLVNQAATTGFVIGALIFLVIGFAAGWLLHTVA